MITGLSIVTSLCVQNLTRSHSGENIADLILNSFDEWNIKSKVKYIVTDNASNMAKAIEILNVEKMPGVKHMRCMGKYSN